MSSKGKRRNRIPNPESQLQQISFGEYKFGDSTNKLSEIKQEKPVFSFRFASLEGKNFCFNSTKIDGVKDYISLIKGIKRLSSQTYDALSRQPSFHFHEVDFSDVSIQQSHFIKCISQNPQSADPEQIPTLYQVKVFRESRVLGFFYSKIFHLVYFDVNHDAYKRK